MKPSVFFSMTCASIALLWSCCDTTPFPFNMSAEGSGEAEPEVVKPASVTTHSPAHVSPTPKVTTAIRLKNFILNQVVDFLRENLLLIVVVSSLAIFLIFIVCCASVMSHKRKLNAYYPSSFPKKKYVDYRDKKGGVRTFTDVSGKPPCTHQTAPLESMKQTQADTKVVSKNFRTPSKALVGEKGEVKEAKPKQCEVQHSKEETCEKEKAAVETTQVTKQEEPKQTPSTTQPLVCLCHLRKGNLSNQNAPSLEDQAALRSSNPASARVQGVVVEVV